MQIKNISKISFTFAIVYFLLFNLVMLAAKFEYSESSIFVLFDAIKDSILACIFLYLLFFGLCIDKRFFVFVSLFLFVTSSIASYYAYTMKILPSKQIIEIFFTAEHRDTKEIISLKIAAWIIFCISIWLILIIKTGVLKIRKKPVITTICLALLIFTWHDIAKPRYRLLKYFLPTMHLHNTFVYLAKDKIVKDRLDINQKYKFYRKENDLNDLPGGNLLEDGLNVILIIGESARYSNFAINGYERDTTPNLSKVNNLLSFKAISASNATHLSIPSLLSMRDAKSLSLAFEETSVISVFNKLNFYTSLIGSQSVHRYLKSRPESTNFYDDFNFTLFPSGGISMSMKLRPYDAELFPYINNAINPKNKKDKVIVIHTVGSHWNYDNRYPKVFQKFTPTCTSESAVPDQVSCSRSSLVNSYDNTILYTDYVVSEIIKKFKDKYAIIIYTSDHGESLGEEGRFGHGTEALTREQIEVPFFVWVSDEYIKRHGEKFENIKSKLGTELSHDYVFHSLLDCANIESEAIDKKLSICSPN